MFETKLAAAAILSDTRSSTEESGGFLDFTIRRKRRDANNRYTANPCRASDEQCNHHLQSGLPTCFELVHTADEKQSYAHRALRRR